MKKVREKNGTMGLLQLPNRGKNEHLESTRIETRDGYSKQRQAENPAL